MVIDKLILLNRLDDSSEFEYGLKIFLYLRLFRVWAKNPEFEITDKKRIDVLTTFLILDVL